MNNAKPASQRRRQTRNTLTPAPLFPPRVGHDHQMAVVRGIMSIEDLKKAEAAWPRTPEEFCAIAAERFWETWAQLQSELHDRDGGGFWYSDAAHKRLDALASELYHGLKSPMGAEGESVTEGVADGDEDAGQPAKKVEFCEIRRRGCRINKFTQKRGLDPKGQVSEFLRRCEAAACREGGAS